MTSHRETPAATALSPAERLDTRLAAVRAALAESPGQIPASLAMPAGEALDAVAERLALGVDHTVVALFGGTGSGKSSLFNALTHLQFADVGARRPTTSQAAACTWGDDAAALLTFLGVDPERRIRRDSALDGDDEADLDGLVFLDVPDYDSVTTTHALQVDRLVPLADILVWVLDPQKYADSALHNGYLRRLGARSEDILILVNHIDTIPEAAQQQLLADVRALLVADGLGEVTLLPVSAVRGDNLDQVRALLVERVARESNAARTAQAHLDEITQRLLPAAAARPVARDEEARAEVTAEFLKASGVPAVGDALRRNLARVLPPALSRPQPPTRSAIEAAHTRWLAAASAGMPSLWVRAVREAVAGPDAAVAACAEAVASVRLPSARSAGISLAWWGGIFAAICGVLLTLVGLMADGVPHLGGLASAGWHVPAGVALVLAGVLSAVVAQRARRARAVREADAYVAQAQQRVEAVVDRMLVDPADEVLARHNRLCEALLRR